MPSGRSDAPALRLPRKGRPGLTCGASVRTFGVETYATGTRNIYDVAIDPQLNVFTRDNTNDGNGWNDRVTYSPPGAYHGYPSRFRRFSKEIVDCLIDTGPGSPCGSLFPW